ncbi:MAG: CidA/LrgA family protein [Pseudomonadota bacterium]
MTPLLPTFGLLLGCQLAGEVVARGLGLPIPGPVLGLALLLVLLWRMPRLPGFLKATTAVILANLSLMFVPAGVGVIGNLDILSGDWLALFVVLFVSTLVAMLAAVATFILVSRLTGEKPQ